MFKVSVENGSISYSGVLDNAQYTGSSAHSMVEVVAMMERVLRSLYPHAMRRKQIILRNENSEFPSASNLYPGYGDAQNQSAPLPRNASETPLEIAEDFTGSSQEEVQESSYNRGSF